MPRFEKWLRVVAAAAPADEVARGALAERLLAVSHFLDKSVGGADETEAIHQLRVWTRRPPRPLSSSSRPCPARGGTNEKAAPQDAPHSGAVRDCDIHLDRLTATTFKRPAA